MAISGLIPRGLFSPGAEMAQQRATLAMTADQTGQMQASVLAQTAGAAPAAGAPAAGTAGPPGETPNSAADAGAAGVAVQPPNTGKIIISSVLSGAVSGAGMFLGVNQFLPKLWPKGAGMLAGILKKIPFVGMKIFGKGMPVAFLAALGFGAVAGGIFGLVKGIGNAKKAAAEYQKAVQSQPIGDPIVLGPDGKPIDPNAPPAGDGKKNPKMDKNYKGVSSKKKARRKKGGVKSGTFKHNVVWGDTLWALSRRYGTSIQAIVKANPGKITNPNLIYAGDTINIPRSGGAKKK